MHRNLVDNKERPITDRTILSYGRGKHTEISSERGKYPFLMLRVMGVLGEGKRQVLIVSRQQSTSRLGNNYEDFKAHCRSLL